MFKLLGSIYSDTEESFSVIKNALEDNGLIIAYRNQTSGEIIQEIPDLIESAEETSES